MWSDQFHQDQENSQIPYNQTQYSLPATGANAQNYQSHIPSHLVEADEIDTSDPNSTIPTSFPPENFYSHPPFPFHSPFPQQSYVNPTYYYPSQYQTNTDVSQQFPPSEFSTFDQSSYNPFTQTSSQYDWSYLPESQTEYTASVETPPSIPSSSVPPSPSSSTASHTINKTPTMSTTNKPPRVMPFRSDATGFVTKLYWLLENREEFGDCIRWDEKGEAFLVDIGSKQFLEEILPDLFLHKSPTSFCRQLQTYDFKRLSTADVDFSLPSIASSSTSPGNPSDWRAYIHPNMQSGKEENLKLLHPRQSKARLDKKKNQMSMDSKKT